MNNRNYLRAKIFILIPIAVFAITAICFGLATLLEVPTSRGTVYSVFALTGKIYYENKRRSIGIWAFFS